MVTAEVGLPDAVFNVNAQDEARAEL